MRSETQAAYQRAGHIHEGICISSCAENVFTILEQMQLRWCPWPDQGFTLAVLEHSRIGMVADRLIISWLVASDHDGESSHLTEKEA